MFWTSFGGLCLYYATEIACFGPDLVDYVYRLLRLHILDQSWWTMSILCYCRVSFRILW